jgi:hypothetical protein
MWTKCIIINSFLALLKGLFGWVSIVPDSKGWPECKERLSTEGIAYFKQEVGDPTSFSNVFWSTLGFEINSTLEGKRLRFCADMMYSGHTYFVTLYALALIELLRKHLPSCIRSDFVRNSLLALVYLVCIIQQTVECVFVIKNRFHYTMDVFMAILLTFLFFTNGTIAIVAKTWKYWEGYFGWFNPNSCKPQATLVSLAKMELDNVPPEVMNWIKKGNHRWTLVPTMYFQESGDTWTPICCFPFCCFWGRYHIMDDEVYKFVKGDEDQDEWSDDEEY